MIEIRSETTQEILEKNGLRSDHIQTLYKILEGSRNIKEFIGAHGKMGLFGEKDPERILYRPFSILCKEIPLIGENMIKSLMRTGIPEAVVKAYMVDLDGADERPYSGFPSEYRNSFHLETRVWFIEEARNVMFQTVKRFLCPIGPIPEY